MPLLTIPPLTPLSSQWTHERMALAVRSSMADQKHAETIQTTDIRVAINIAILDTYETIQASEQSHPYAILWPFTLDPVIGTRYFQLDLSGFGVAYAPLQVATPNGSAALLNVTPVTLIQSIQSIVCVHDADIDAMDPDDVAALWLGAAAYATPQAFWGAAAGDSTNLDQSVIWTRSGAQILIYLGSRIQRTALPLGYGMRYIKPQRLLLSGTRRPLLDNLGSIFADVTTSSWTQYLDVPDEYALEVLNRAKAVLLGPAINQEDPNAGNVASQAQMGKVQVSPIGLANDQQRHGGKPPIG